MDNTSHRAAREAVDLEVVDGDRVDLVIDVRSRTWSPSGFVNAGLRKRCVGDLDGLGRPGSPRGRWIPPFGGRVLHVRTLDCLLS